MFIMFISLFFSVTIGSVLYTSENSLKIFQSSSSSTTKSKSSHSTEMEMSVVAQKLTERISPRPPEFITTLTSLRKWSKEIYSDTPKPILENLSFYRVDSGIFFEYANEENLMIEFEPGCCDRIASCRLNNKNLFNAVPLDLHENWVKILIKQYRLGSLLDNVENTSNDECKAEITDDSVKLAEGYEATKKKIKKAKLKNAKLIQKTELSKQIRDFIDKKRTHKTNSCRQTERALTYPTIIGVWLIFGYYVIPYFIH